MLIQVDGWFAGGKTLLWSLLDGHKDIFVNPIHDYSFSMFLDKKDDDEWILKKHSIVLRKILSTSEYYKFEKIYLEKKYQIHFSTNKIMDVDYNVDFYKFDKLFFSRLNDMKSWTIEEIINCLYSSYYDIYKGLEKIKYPKYFASMSHPGHFDKYQNIPNIFPNMKSILVKRNIKNIIATRMNRKERPKDLNSFQAFRTPLKKILDTKEIEKILNYFETYDELQKKFPSQFFIVDFDELVLNPQEAMKKVANFLEIEYEDILSIPTRDGNLLELDGVSFIGKENDTFENLLTKEEQNIIDTRINTYNKNINSDEVNVDKNKAFFRTFNHLLIDLDVISRKFNKIAIYGNHFLADSINSYLAAKSIGVFNEETINSLAEDYEVILVASLGNEEIVSKLLVEKYNIEKEKIIYIHI